MDYFNSDSSQTDFLWSLLENPANDAGLYAYNLKRLVDEFPQSGVLQALLAHASDEKNLKRASAYFNPRALFKLINAPSTFTGVPADRIFIQPGISTNGVERSANAAAFETKDHDNTESYNEEELVVDRGAPSIESAPEAPEHTETGELVIDHGAEEYLSHFAEEPVHEPAATEESLMPEATDQVHDTIDEPVHEDITADLHDHAAESIEETAVAEETLENFTGHPEEAHTEPEPIVETEHHLAEDYTGAEAVTEQQSDETETHVESVYADEAEEPVHQAEVADMGSAHTGETEEPVHEAEAAHTEHVHSAPSSEAETVGVENVHSDEAEESAHETELTPIEHVHADEPEESAHEIEPAEAQSVHEDEIPEPEHSWQPDEELPQHVAEFEPPEEEPVQAVDLNEEHEAEPSAEIPGEEEVAPEPEITAPADEMEETYDEIVGIDDIKIGQHSTGSFFSFEHEFGAHEDAQPGKIEEKDIIEEASAEAGTQDVSQYNDEKMPYTFLWWLDKTRKEHAQADQPYVKAPMNRDKKIRKPADMLQQQYIENIFHITSVEELDKSTTKPPVKPNLKKKEQNIIERFIREEPQIKPQSSDKLDNENKARKSSEDRDEMVTETLAGIYTDQMLYHKAISSYKKLMLKFPEKSRYFAEKIEQLEKKTN